jgi:hypothetical protein
LISSDPDSGQKAGGGARIMNGMTQTYIHFRCSKLWNLVLITLERFVQTTELITLTSSFPVGCSLSSLTYFRTLIDDTKASYSLVDVKLSIALNSSLYFRSYTRDNAYETSFVCYVKSKCSLSA